MADTWMRAALIALIDHLDEAAGRRALTDPTAFAKVRGRLDGLMPGEVPAGERGDNLVRALLALRVKFSPEEARAKMETNLAMRGVAPATPVDGGRREPARGSSTTVWAQAEDDPAEAWS